MATLEQEGTEYIAPRRPAIALPRLRWTQILAISIFCFALNFHWTALGIIILPSQVFKIAGNATKGTALAYVLVPGAFVSLFANPLFGMLSDRTHGRLAAWGRRRPYILFGTLVNVLGLIWMAASHDIPTLTLAYVLVQFSSNAAQAPFHALLPDIVPAGQRGLVSGVMGLLAITGTIGGVIVAGLFVAASKPLPEYQRGLWLTYGIIIAVLVPLMLVTLISVRERMGASAQLETQEAEKSAEAPVQDASLEQPRRLSWVQKIPRSTKINVLSTLVVAAAAGWLSDRFGRKRIVYFSGGFMALVGLVFVIAHSLVIALAAGAIFGLGYGAYQSVDWALVVDVLPSHRNYARDMGIWNISLSLPQVIAPVIGGPIIDSFTRSGNSVAGYQAIFIMAIVYCLIGTVTVRYIKGVKR